MFKHAHTTYLLKNESGWAIVLPLGYLQADHTVGELATAEIYETREIANRIINWDLAADVKARAVRVRRFIEAELL